MQQVSNFQVTKCIIMLSTVTVITIKSHAPTSPSRISDPCYPCSLPISRLFANTLCMIQKDIFFKITGYHRVWKQNPNFFALHLTILPAIAVAPSDFIYKTDPLKSTSPAPNFLPSPLPWLIKELVHPGLFEMSFHSLTRKVER